MLCIDERAGGRPKLVHPLVAFFGHSRGLTDLQSSRQYLIGQATRIFNEWLRSTISGGKMLFLMEKVVNFRQEFCNKIFADLPLGKDYKRIRHWSQKQKQKYTYFFVLTKKTSFDKGYKFY